MIQFINKRTSKMLQFLFLLCLMVLSQGRKLIFVQELFRHGARYPLKTNTADDSEFASEERLTGELTAQGKHQQYILGRIMYQKYWEALFEGTPYLNKYHPSQLYVRSTNVNRTLQSAESQLIGLLQHLNPYQLPIEQLNNSLPPYPFASDYQPTQMQIDNDTVFRVYGEGSWDYHTIPIHTVKQDFVPQSSDYPYRANPYDQGDFLAKYSKHNCPNQQLWANQNFASEEAIRIKDSQQVKQFLSELSGAVGTKVAYRDAWSYIDNYFCLKYMGRPTLPLFDDPDKFKVADFILLSSDLFLRFYTELQIKTSNTMLIEKTLYNIKQAIAGKGQKMILYSAHDTTILSFNSALGLVSLDCVMDYFYNGANNSDTCINKFPRFATSVVVEVWQQDSMEHTVKVLYNGQERKMPMCGYNYQCSFAEFEKWANDFLLDDPNESCGVHQQYAKLYIVIGILIVLVAALMGIIFWWRFKGNKEDRNQQIQMLKRGSGEGAASEKEGYIEHIEEQDL